MVFLIILLVLYFGSCLIFGAMAFEGYYLYSSSLYRFFDTPPAYSDDLPKYVVSLLLIGLLLAIVLVGRRQLKKKSGSKVGKIILIVCLVLVSVFPLVSQFIHMSQNGEFFDGYYIAYDAKKNDGTCTVHDIEVWPGVKTIEIPETLGGYKVTELKGSALRYCVDLETLKVSKSVKCISSSEFDGFYTNFCENLKHVVIEDLESWCEIDLESNPFYDAPGLMYLNDELLTDLVIPDGVTQIKQGAFVSRVCLTSLTIGSDVTEIGDYAFRNCTDLRSVEIGAGVTKIGVWAFSGCASLTSVTYNGTIEQWKAISKPIGWGRDFPATQVVCSDGVVALN